MITVRSASLVLPVPPEAVFGLLADPSAHGLAESLRLLAAALRDR